MSQSVLQLGALRFVTGLGIGGMMASLNIMVAEYTPGQAPIDISQKGVSQTTVTERTNTGAPVL